jgi:enediyne biosynthesis protein E4
VIAHFGLGSADKIDTITIYWTGGNKQTITNVSANQLITIKEIPQAKSHNYISYILIGLVLVGVVFIFATRRKKT